jgi:hypothetical protein
VGLRLAGIAIVAASALAAGATAARSTSSLLATYAPIESSYRSDWRPSSVEPFLKAADLERLRNGVWQLVARSPSAAALAHGGSDLRLNTRGCTPALDPDSCYSRVQGPATLYGRVWVAPTVSAGIATVLQYWFFYPLDDWRNSPTKPTLWHMHEGDWEEVSVALDAAGHPVAVAASQHDVGVTRRWAQVPKSTTHPRVYVALGSHANYFRPGFHRIPQSFDGLPLSEPDYTSAQITRRPPVTDISDGKAPWLSFAGAWGDGSYVQLGAVAGGIYAHVKVGDSPSGPAQHDIWKDPLLAFRTWPADDGH